MKSFLAKKQNKEFFLYLHMHMKFLLLGFLFSLAASSRITSADRKNTCSNCKFYIPNKMKCTKFGETDIITGRTTYEFALNSRSDENECGPEGKYFERNRAKFLTTSYYVLSEYLEILVASSNCSVDPFRLFQR